MTTTPPPRQPGNHDDSDTRPDHTISSGDVLNWDALDPGLLRVQQLASMTIPFACMAHEICSPLNAIKMGLFSLQQIAEELPRYKILVQDRIQVLQEEIDRLDSYVRNFLDFTRFPDPVFKHQPLPEVFERVARLLRHSMDKSGVTMECHIEDDLPDVIVDAHAVQQVFINLMVNAMEAMEDGGQIRVTMCQEHHEDQEWVCFRIQDEGPGIPIAVRERIFQPFFTTKADGNGLGLYVTRQIVRKHKGRFALEPSAVGTAFAVHFPAAGVSEEIGVPDGGA